MSISACTQSPLSQASKISSARVWTYSGSAKLGLAARIPASRRAGSAAMDCRRSDEKFLVSAENGRCLLMRLIPPDGRILHHRTILAHKRKEGLEGSVVPIESGVWRNLNSLHPPVCNCFQAEQPDAHTEVLSACWRISASHPERGLGSVFAAPDVVVVQPPVNGLLAATQQLGKLVAVEAGMSLFRRKHLLSGNALPSSIRPPTPAPSAGRWCGRSPWAGPGFP